MSIYIKGMKMPRFFDRLFVGRSFDGGIYIRNEREDEKSESVTWYPVRKVPPHGRLIDADALEKSLVAQIEQCTRLLESLECVDNLREFESQREVLKEILEEINNALTVIPADKED